MKFFILCILSNIVISCKNSEQQKSGGAAYPDEIIKRNLNTQYDNAKWLYYASNFYNDTVWETAWKPKLEKYRKIIEFEIEPSEIKIQQDTLDVYFGIKVLDTSKLYTIATRHKYCRMGITSINPNPVYRLGCSQSVILNYSKPYPFKGGIFTKTDYPDTTIIRLKSYDLYPLDEQEELFKKYLISNEKYLCSWLKAEAIKRGIIR